MPTSRPMRFVASSDAAAFVDLDTGLLWRPWPGGRSIPFDQALGRGLGRDWRLPSVGELMGVLCGGAGAMPRVTVAPGTRLWTGSQSPFGPEREVRIVVCDAGPTYGVSVLEKTQKAQVWLVGRTPSRPRSRGEGPPP